MVEGEVEEVGLVRSAVGGGIGDRAFLVKGGRCINVRKGC
jgi:hypothetical protein